MGHVRTAIRIAHPERRELAVDIQDALVDTGASFTTLPRQLAQQLELALLGQLKGRTAAVVQTLDQSYAYIEMAGKRSGTPILISDTLDIVLIGVLTLEALALTVDPGAGQLKESEVLLL